MNDLIDIMDCEREGESTRQESRNHGFIITACGYYKSELRKLSGEVGFRFRLKSSRKQTRLQPRLFF